MRGGLLFLVNNLKGKKESSFKVENSNNLLSNVNIKKIIILDYVVFNHKQFSNRYLKIDFKDIIDYDYIKFVNDRRNVFNYIKFFLFDYDNNLFFWNNIISLHYIDYYYVIKQEGLSI